MLISEIIRSKRDGQTLDSNTLGVLVRGIADNSVPDEQIAAFCMAVYHNGMSFDEAAALTREMASSGRVLAWRSDELGGPVIDKHSTGGVGDKVSFMLAPIAAACGCYVPMISGRGLGHSGGTLDKIECIPGYNATPDLETLRRVVKKVGCAIIGQTSDLAPADARIYAVRDVTATVESIPLITASILSKKIAAGNDFLVMDVKVGSGAFMTSEARAVELAESLIGTAHAAGLKTHALLTDMDEPLGTSAGHMLEMREVYAYLTGQQRDARLDEVVLALAAEMLVMTGLAEDRDGARGMADATISSGKAAEVFMHMTRELGGAWDYFDRFEHYFEAAPVIMPVYASADGSIAAMDTREIGQTIVGLGGGRRKSSDKIDLRVGFSDILPIGAAVNRDRPMAMVHAASQDDAQRAAAAYRDACTISEKAPDSSPVIKKIMTRRSRAQ